MTAFDNDSKHQTKKKLKPKKRECNVGVMKPGRQTWVLILVKVVPLSLHQPGSHEKMQKSQQCIGQSLSFRVWHLARNHEKEDSEKVTDTPSTAIASSSISHLSISNASLNISKATLETKLPDLMLTELLQN
jgi:hypothetical protein